MVYTKELITKYNVDVFVAGGGASGIAAAIAAARQGKSVFLAEATGMLGGLATSGMVPSFAPFTDGVNILSSGIGLEVRNQVSDTDIYKTEWTPYDIENLKRVYDNMMKNSGADFTFFTTVCDVVATNGHIDYVVCTAKSGMFAVKAKIYIDCTGDGDICAMAGGEYEFGENHNKEVMPGTLCSLWADIDWENRERVAPNKHIEQAYKDGVLTYEDRHLPGFYQRPDKLYGGNVGHLFDIDPTDERSLTDAMIWGRYSLTEYENYFKKYFVGYDNMKLCTTASVPGIRESRRVVCDYTLTVDDFIARANFEDEIGRYCYPVDVHVKATSKENYDAFEKEYNTTLRYAKGESYGIPYRSLVAKSFDNLLVAGRCMGVDKKMQASIRVMPGCFIAGQAAGVAAALASASAETRNVKYDELASSLLKLGAYLPNYK